MHAATAIAIGVDEGIHSLADVRWHYAERAARGDGLKAIKLGGLRALVTAGAAALHAACVMPMGPGR